MSSAVSTPRTVRVINLVLAFNLALMVVLVFANVVLRYGFNSGIAQSEEVARLLFVWLTFLGAVVALREGAHLGVDTLVRNLGPGGQRACWAASQLLMLACCAVVAWGGWQVTRVNLGSEAAVSGFSLAWIYGSVLVCALGMGLLVLRNLARLLAGRDSPADWVMVQDSEESHAAEPPGAAR